ncbi:magnesium transporter [Idiomarina loihiensis]|jgi:magnesium transporter|uniref:Magnesium transporter MgtE n=1 Tax=Idiomarina loihiensis (strain ATCC BAA-735 / DSM 15497 / L2-TR) TaxID=283942 RepID=Q5R0I4_IDILO|nr:MULTISPECIES: magnesium transporter [Idiomarina]AAV81234.1 Mg/Co/Ni transporter MgtE (contains CBS domain) [Idiomarina loihiensis L2TR]AGM35259.1 magnesium transporter [Idiomarina loihiensis GSL 199]MAA62253.1 magnesium transporter [Idiomarina sp.]MRJ45314.1 magnesium transporter [Idiomarina loihiensis]PHQ93027.1 MAG: magnesium transporter [Idiomarina sp.]|tara:strand:- start:22106 stop:23467 length:1362 start_codon:yes stop_codon:yes gene_type:complete
MIAELSDKEYAMQRIQEVNSALSDGMFVAARRMLHNMPACDVALLLESSPPKSRSIVWKLVDVDEHGEILEELNEEVQKDIIRQMAPENLAAATEGMDTDDLAYVLRGLPEPVYQQVLKSMDESDRERAETALSYAEDSAGGIMNTDTITLRSDVTIDVVLRYLRLKGELPEATDKLYVVDRHEKLIGEITLTQLLTIDPSRRIDEIMSADITTIPVTMDETEVAKLFERHDWVSAPVVDNEQQLVGRITIDDVVDIIREEAQHSMLSMAGLEDDEDTFAPVLKSTRRRTVWLAVNLVTALLAAMVSSLFEDILAQMAVLAILNTIVPSMGGIAGSQTLTLVIRGMALGHIGTSNSRWLIGKELAIGFLNGIIWSVLIAAVVALWKQDWLVGGIIAFAMMMNLVAAALAGATIPLVLKRFNIDPALAGGVILTTVTDVVGIFAFLGSATLLLS